MTLLTPHKGLQFSIAKPDGFLAFTLFLNGKRVSKSEIFEIESDTSPKIELSTFNGLHITAVDLELFLVKNDGTLELEYTGHTGASGSWDFRGLELDSGVEKHPERYMAATAKTQIDTVTTRMMEVQTETVLIKEPEMKASTAAMEDKAVQTESPNACSIIEQKKSAKETELGFGLKRKTSGQPEPLKKRVKSTSNSEQWPKYLFMSCDVHHPLFWGPHGTLTLDLENARVWLTRGGARRTTVKHIDLQDPNIQAIYNPSDRNARFLTVMRFKYLRIHGTCFEVSQNLVLDTIWGNDDGSDTKTRLYTDPTIVLEAIVHCIDRSSGREPIHDPDARSKYKEANARYEVLKEEGLIRNSLSRSVAHSWHRWNELIEKEKCRLLRYEAMRVIRS